MKKTNQRLMCVLFWYFFLFTYIRFYFILKFSLHFYLANQKVRKERFDIVKERKKKLTENLYEANEKFTSIKKKSLCLILKVLSIGCFFFVCFGSAFCGFVFTFVSFFFFCFLLEQNL